MEAQRVSIGGGQYGIDIILSASEISEYFLNKIGRSSDAEAQSDSTSITTSRPAIGESHFMIPEEALATYKQLLGTNSDRETIQYLMFIREHGEPAVEPDGTNAWTSAYEELESKLELQSAKGISEEEVDEEDESALATVSAKVKSLASSLAKASTNLLSTASADSDEEEELTGIDKTRSRLGLPSRVVSKSTKIQLLSLASANVMAADDTSDLVSDNTFYEISDDILGLFDQDVIAEAEVNFLDSLIPKQNQ